MNIVVNLNKNPSITSHDAVTAVKKTYKVKKAGHAGTLDPAATGVLLVCLNEATKITGFLSDLDKEYIVTAKLGECTGTYDSEGVVIKKTERFTVTGSEIETAILKFTGDIEQIPPMHSAIKVSGRPLYELARKGIEIERKPRRISIKAIEVLNFESPFLTLKVSCSKGTYIRSLCNDLGNELGVGAYITELVRTRIGDFTIDNSAGIDDLPHKAPALYSIDTALRHLPEIKVEWDNLKRAKNGNPIRIGQKCGRQDSAEELKESLQASGLPGFSSAFIRLKDPEGKLFGIGKKGKDSVKIERLFNL